MDNRKEKIRQYKQTPAPMGVYKITELKNGNMYVGCAKNLDAIKNRHLFELRFSIHTIKELQDAWNELGENGISFAILDKLEPKDDPAYDYTKELETLDELWVEKLRSEGVKFERLMKGTRVRK